jgi:hypothetical protein
MMSNEILSSLNESSITIDMTPPIRRVAADASFLTQTNSNEQNHFISRPSISMKKVKKNSYNLVKQSISKNNKNNIEPPIVLRERSTSSSSSSSKSSNNDSLRSLEGNISINDDDDDDDDDASSNDEINHQWNLNQSVRHIPLGQLSKSIITIK